MTVYDLKDVKVLSQDPEWGTTFWCTADGIDVPLKFNKKIDHIPIGTRIAAEEVTERTSAKGIHYLQLKKVTIEDNKLLKTPENASESKSAPVFKTENKRGITASMATKLAYVEWIRCEGMLPQTAEQWAGIQTNARNLMFVVDQITDEQIDGIEETVSGYQKAKQARKSLSVDEANDFVDSLGDGDDLDSALDN